MSEQKCRKVYVPVNLDVDAEGNIRPRLIRWIDGRVYEIDRLKHKCRASSTKVGGCGIRYTVMIGGHESFLFNEDEKWFVEAKEQCLYWTRPSTACRHPICGLIAVEAGRISN